MGIFKDVHNDKLYKKIVRRRKFVHSKKKLVHKDKKYLKLLDQFEKRVYKR